MITAWHIQRDEHHFHCADGFLLERWVPNKHTYDSSWVPYPHFDEEVSSTTNHARPAENQNIMSFSAGGRSFVGCDVYHHGRAIPSLQVRDKRGF